MKRPENVCVMVGDENLEFRAKTRFVTIFIFLACWYCMVPYHLNDFSYTYMPYYATRHVVICFLFDYT